MEQSGRRGFTERRIPRFVPTRPYRPDLPTTATSPRRDLLFYNGLGGFTPDGREYVITTAHGQVTPAPWVNVLANPHFGTVISENGMAYTWSENAHEFRLTPWGNDAVSDASGEAFYLRDEESGHFWSPAPLPSRGATPYVSRHGFGYSSFEHTEDGISSELTVYVALDAAVKFSVLKVRNESGRARRLSATGYVEWVLGDLRPKSAMHVITEIDPFSGAFYARNAYNTEFADRIAFFDVDDTTRTFSGDRAEFIGRNGTLAHPAAMTRSRLSNKAGAALDPCAAIQVAFELADGEEREFDFRLGVAGRRGADEANKLVRRFRGPTAARDALEAVREYWKRTLGAVQVETPDQSLNLLANGWLVYQTLACRLWGRSGYYQSGGAFGFRDQLQDVMALVHAEPALVREHLLRCAARQFREGDVQHWWHATSGRGVRTHCSDDFLWLPLALCRYVSSSGDTGVLDESISFLDGRPVNPDEDSYYDLPGRSEESATLYQHGVRAILRGLSFGAHGLPLIGSGDWNDGMNAVGDHGKGESVWLAFFLYDVLMRFSELARTRSDTLLRRALPDGGRHTAPEYRAQRLGRRVVPARLFRRRYAAGIGEQRRMPDRCPSAKLGRALRRRGTRARAHGDGGGGPAPGAPRCSADPGARPAVRQVVSEPGLYKGLRAGRARKRRAIHARGGLDGDGVRRLGDSARAWELFGMINPVKHADSAAAIATYKVEPYVVAADVYAVAPHTGRGGWTWYTGSAGWLYRLILESLLGLTLEVDKLRFAPCLPADWKTFKLHYRYRETVYHITVLQTPAAGSKTGVTVDGVEQQDGVVPLVDDQQEHIIEVRVVAQHGENETTPLTDKRLEPAGEVESTGPSSSMVSLGLSLAAQGSPGTLSPYVRYHTDETCLLWLAERRDILALQWRPVGAMREPTDPWREAMKTCIAALLLLVCGICFSQGLPTRKPEHPAAYPTESQLRTAIENAAKLAKAEGLDVEIFDAQKVGMTQPLLAARLNVATDTCQIFYNTKPEDGLTQYFETIVPNDLPVLLIAMAVHEVAHCIEYREAYVRKRFDKILPPGFRSDSMTVQGYMGAVKSGTLQTWGEALADIASLLYLKQATPNHWLELAKGVAGMRHDLARKWPEHDTSPWLYRVIAADANVPRNQSLFETAFQLRRLYRPEAKNG